MISNLSNILVLLWINIKLYLQSELINPLINKDLDEETFGSILSLFMVNYYSFERAYHCINTFSKYHAK